MPKSTTRRGFAALAGGVSVAAFTFKNRQKRTGVSSIRASRAGLPSSPARRSAGVAIAPTMCRRRTAKCSSAVDFVTRGPPS